MPWHPVTIDTLASRLALSASQLRRRCLHAVGVGPKVLQRTLRFQGFLALAQAGAMASGKRGADGVAGLTVDFDWYTDGDTPSRVFDGFRLSEPSARFFDAIAARDGAIVAGRTTYEHSSHFGGGSPHPTARLFVVNHRPVPDIGAMQTLVTSGVEDAIAAAREAAGDKDVGLMGGGLVTEALKAGLVDELILHQVPILLGGGRPFFHAMPAHVHLRLLEAVAAPGVTHLHYEVVR